MNLARRAINEIWPDEPRAVRAAMFDVLAAAAWRYPAPAHARVRPGFLSAVRLYAAALRHPAAADELRGSLFDIAVSRVVFVRRAA